MQAVSDFSRGKVSGNILRLAMPMVVAQLVNVLYNIVDRMYIGHMPEDSVNALTGVGLTFPILLIVTGVLRTCSAPAACRCFRWPAARRSTRMATRSAGARRPS